MSRGFLTAFLGILAAASTVRAQAPVPAIPQSSETAPLNGPPTDSAWPVDGPSGNGRVWAEADFMLWWMRGAALPPLVTTSPAGTPISQAGVLGNPTTTVLFGDSAVNDEVRAGGRVALGYWFDDAHTCGVEGDFFMLETRATHFAATSNGAPILARPFFDATTGLPSSERIAFPGDTTGSVQASEGSTGLIGASLLARENLWCICGVQLDVLFGYRYLTFSDRLGVDENLTNINPNNPNFIPVGANILVSDRFDTKNDLHALDVGLTGVWQGGPWTASMRGQLAVGYDHQVVEITGATTATVAGVPPVVNSGGLLALGSNIGHHSRDDVSVVPQLDVKLAYQVTPNLTASLGYTFLYWGNVVRAADQIDQTINPSLLPPAVTPATGPIRPEFSFQRSYLWAQGLDFGFEFRF